MNNSYYIYFVLTFIAVFSVWLFFNFRPSKNHINNKILLKNLLESLELDLPDELKRLDNSTTDSRKLS